MGSRRADEFRVLRLQVVISPRVLAPSLAGTSNSSAGSALYSRLTDTFGYLNKAVRGAQPGWY